MNAVRDERYDVIPKATESRISTNSLFDRWVLAMRVVGPRANVSARH